MRITYSGAAAGLVALVLAGCSSGPEITVTSSGAMPAGGTFAVVEDDPEGLSRSVSDFLAGHGLTKSEAPRYIVQVSYAERPAGSGLLVPRDADPQWLRRPDFRHGRQPIATLGISVVEAAGGREIYSASASGRPRPDSGAWKPFLQALFPRTAPNAD